jgi:hypothetical protein
MANPYRPEQGGHDGRSGLSRKARLPAAQQQLSDLASSLCRQTGQKILEVGVWVMPVEFGRANQAHHRGNSFARAQRSREQPVIALNRNGPDLVLNPIVVHGQMPVLDEARQRTPAFEAVVQGSGRGRAIRDLLGRQQHPPGKRLTAYCLPSGSSNISNSVNDGRGRASTLMRGRARPS